MSFKDVVIRKSKDHLHTVNETYWEHMLFALYVVWTLLCSAVLLTIHLLVPAWCEFSASSRICKLADDMRARRAKNCGTNGHS